MDEYITVKQCKQTEASVKSRMKWLSWLMAMMIGITAITAEEAWRARAGFDEVNIKLESTMGVSAAERSAIQKSLDRIDRRLEQQEEVLLDLLKTMHKQQGTP